MTLVERLRSFEGRQGDYKWKVEVWRSDTTAVANLRVRLKVFRMRSNPWFIPDTHKKVFQETEVASEESVEGTVSELRHRGKNVAGRFDAEAESVSRIPDTA